MPPAVQRATPRLITLGSGPGERRLPSTILANSPGPAPLLRQGPGRDRPPPLDEPARVPLPDTQPYDQGAARCALHRFSPAAAEEA